MVARRQIVRVSRSSSPLSDGKPIPCVVIRGGTSRGLFFHDHDLPRHPRLRDSVIMGAVGAPDPRQVDGLGGADMLLSKVAIVSRSKDDDADIECEFANIAPGKDRPTFGTNCGNLVAAVALFAIDEGLISSRERHVEIRIRNKNSGNLIDARIGRLAGELGVSTATSGMSNSGVCVDLDFLDPVGTVRKTLLPTGSARDTFALGDGRSVDVSVVDAGALYVFARAADLGLTATESAQ
ncbi:MAG: PrpF domain-containing protein, partial [Woeseiaceae bacterium]